MIKIEKIKNVVLFVFILFTTGCYADNTLDENITVFVYSPITEQIVFAYEISFFEDGLIRSIQYFGSCEPEINPTSWDSSDCEVVKEITVIREGDIVNVVSHVPGIMDSEIIMEHFEITAPDSIVRTVLRSGDRKDRITLEGELGSFVYYSQEQKLIELTIEDQSFFLHYPTSTRSISYYFSNTGILQAIVDKRNERERSVDVLVSKGHQYTLIKPGTGDPEPYLVKIEVIVKYDKSFTPINSVLNYFILPANERIYLLPFVTQEVVSK